jgi:hypothetical protein
MKIYRFALALIPLLIPATAVPASAPGTTIKITVKNEAD